MFDIEEYRNSVLSALKESGNLYGTKVVTLNKFGREFSYHKWQHPFQGDWEYTHLFTDEILERLSKIISPGSTVIDIGAQTGNMTVAYSLFAEKVIAFEPNPAAFNVLQQNAELNQNIIPFNYAISDVEGPVEFHYSDWGFCNGGYASRTEYGIGVTGHRVPMDVYAVNFEKFVEEEGLDLGNISLLKIDAEGHDRDILKTLRKTIDTHKPIIITEIYTGLTRNEVNDLLETIHSLGYKAYDEEINHLNLENLGQEIKVSTDINPKSGNNLVCVYDSE